MYITTHVKTTPTRTKTIHVQHPPRLFVSYIAFCRDRLAHFKCPTLVEFVEALPRTATGKLQKYRLREEHWGSARKVN